jgi:chemotaxis protein methyltransferase CheR
MCAISDEELTSITRAIHSRYGIDFAHYEPVSFKRRVARVISRYGLENSLGLWRKMLSDGQFIFTFIDEITVGLTEMFRNAEFWLRMRSDILPQFYAKTASTSGTRAVPRAKKCTRWPSSCWKKT